MPKLTWEIVNLTQASNNITQYVRSLNLTIGRPTALSSYSGNGATITMLSYGGLESLVSVNDEIMLSSADGVNLYDIYIGRVTSRTFDDNPGTGIDSTMIVNLNDAMLQAGVANLQNQSLISVNDQISEIDTVLPQIEILSDNTDIDISVGAFTTNANQRINEIIAGDRGLIFNVNAVAYYRPPSIFTGFNTEDFTISRDASGDHIAYSNIVRIESAANSLFYTQATVTGSVATETSNSENIATYGTRTFTVTTAQTQLVGQVAAWYANTFSDPETVMLSLTIFDISQTQAALQLFNNWLGDMTFVRVVYQPPGESEINGYFWPEQMTINVTTSMTTIDLIMSPMTYYANFILNDDVFGVLDTDRLGV